MKQSSPLTIECRFPSSELSTLTSEGSALVENLSRENGEYIGTLSIADVPGFFDLLKGRGFTLSIQSSEETIIKPRAGRLSATSYNRKTNGKTNGKSHKRKYAVGEKRQNKITLLREVLSKKWMSIPDLEKATQSNSSTIYARMTGLRSEGVLKSKVGPDGRKIYHVKKSGKGNGNGELNPFVEQAND